MTVHISQTHDLATCLRLRRDVFITEQGVSEADELDGCDAGAIHLLAHKDDTPVGTARILLNGSVGKIGRVCVLASFRGSGIGAMLIAHALELLQREPGVSIARLGAQTHALEFYARLGFVAVGSEYLDAGILHLDMERAV